jgi:serine-type D-Ala-D-Ala carboxypeptidase/endopeptidase (penicillin-binding protein 4)
MRILTIALAALLSACTSLPDAARDAMGAPDLAGVRWGLVVTTTDGRELVAIRPDERFKPASNTKLFTVAAAFRRLGDVSQPDPSMGASVRLEPRGNGQAPDIVLVGGGDAALIDADDCERDCLSDLADIVQVNGVTRVNDVIADDGLFPDQRWGEGWSQEDLIYRPGAPTSALTINSNEVSLRIAPDAKAGDPVSAAWRTGDEFFELLNEAITVEGDKDQLRLERKLGSNTVRLFGTMGVTLPSQTIPMAVEDPAEIAAWRFRRLLEARGVKIEGKTVARHRPLALADDPAAREAGLPPPPEKPAGAEIARLLPPPLIEDVRFLMKQSQNQHAEVLLRRLGLVEGRGSRADGLAIIEAMLTESGAERSAWDLHDGSGMSVYNRVTPRMVARFLLWTTQQPWGEVFRDTLPVGGVDGTLARRFRGTPLEGRIFAKTGTFDDTNALAGFMMTESGEMLIFSAHASDRPSGAGSATAAMDAALVAIATGH